MQKILLKVEHEKEQMKATKNKENKEIRKKNEKVVSRNRPSVTKKHLILLSKEIIEVINKSRFWVFKENLSKKKILLILKLATISKKLI